MKMVPKESTFRCAMGRLQLRYAVYSIHTLILLSHFFLPFFLKEKCLQVKTKALRIELGQVEKHVLVKELVD